MRRLQSAGSGSVICGSAVQGAATFTGNQGGIQLGPNGALAGCASGGYFARDVTISNTAGPSRVDDNIINGRLILSGNNPTATVAPNNRIRGGVSGEHQATGMNTLDAMPSRSSTAQQRAEERRAKALSSAGV